MAAELGWGRQYAVVRPDHFSVNYAINPFMDLMHQPDADVARRQWEALVETLRSCRADVDIIPARPDSPDMVYAMNLGLTLGRDCVPGVVMSHMRFPQRRSETVSASRWFEDSGFAPSYLGRDGIGAHFEAGDAFPVSGALVVGYGPRTEELALKHLAAELQIEVRGLRIVHPGMYHLDLAFCPLDADHALICPDALDDASAAAALELVAEPIVLTAEEALTFCANSVVIGRTVVMPACPTRVRAELEAAGFEVVVVDVSQFHKGGGSVRCLTNPLDIRLGRDLTHVPGGKVVIPPAL